MKRIYSFIAAALTIISAASCVQELSHDAHHQDDAIVYTAIAEGADTKAVLGTSESGRQQFLWEDGDVIYINPGGGSSYMFSTSLTEPSAVADFVYQGTDGFQIQTGQPVIATYPFGSWVQMEYRYVVLPIPSAQQIDPEVESYNKLAVPVAAYSTDNSLHFKNTTALLKCQVSQANVTKIRFYGLNEEAVAGHSLVCFKENGEIDYVGIPNGNNEFYVELSAAPGKVFQSDRSYYLSVIPNTLESGFAVELYDSNDDLLYTKRYDRSITIKRNVILNLGMLGESSDIEPSADDYIDEYGINHGPGVEIDGVVWAPVNCGYHAEDFPWGKLYQWGRKYGQGYDGNFYDGDWDQDYSDVTYPEIEEGPVSFCEGQDVNSSNKFYLGEDWSDNYHSDIWNLGNEYNPIKTEYDPCPDGWRVPTISELELMYQNHSSFTTNGEQMGYWFSGSSPYSSDVPQVFLPAAGRRSYSKGKAKDRGYYGLYWSSTSDYPVTKRFRFYDDNFGTGSNCRAYGLSVRCVQDDSELIPVSSVTLNTSSLMMQPGTRSSIYTIVAPSNANHQSAYWSSSDTSVAIVDQAGNVTAVSPGNATITAMAGMKTATCEVTVSEEAPSDDYVDEYGINHGPGVEIDGVVWAPVNCGYHETDFKYGKLYQWGRKYGQGYSDNNYTDVNVPAISDNITSFAGIQSRENKNVYFTGLWDYYVQNFSQSQLSLIWNAGTEIEPMKSQYDPCPDGWRIPLHSEYDNLRQNHSELVEENSISGYWLSGSVPYSMEANQVFLPLAGGRDFGQARDRNELGYYYSSKPGGFFGLYEDGPHMVNYSQYSLACSVRCVQDDSEYISQETILWEGEAIADDWNNQPYLLSDGGVELLNAGAQPGQKVCFYVEPLQSDWKVDIWEGHWGPVYLSVCSVGNDTDGGKFTEYDLDANGGKIELTLTQDILDTAYSQQWWGGTFLLSGDNLKCTKITLQ